MCCSAGCPSTTVYRSADPVPRGKWRVGGALGLGGQTDRAQKTRSPSGHLELSARRGVSQNVDIGAKLYMLGAEANATWRIARGSKWSYAIAPSVGGIRTPENAVVVDAINLFIGINGVASRPLSQRWTLSVGPLSGWGLYWPETGGSAQGLWLGAFAAGEARLGTRWRITPELGFYRVVSGQVPVRGSALRFGAALSRDL